MVIFTGFTYLVLDSLLPAPYVEAEGSKSNWEEPTFRLRELFYC